MDDPNNFVLAVAAILFVIALAALLVWAFRTFFGGQSSTHGTCAREKFEVPATTGSGGGRRSVRPRESVCHCWAMRSVSRSPEPSSSGATGAAGASDRVSSAPFPTRTG